MCREGAPDLSSVLSGASCFGLCVYVCWVVVCVNDYFLHHIVVVNLLATQYMFPSPLNHSPTCSSQLRAPTTHLIFVFVLNHRLYKRNAPPPQILAPRSALVLNRLQPNPSTALPHTIARPLPNIYSLIYLRLFCT